MSFEDEYGGGDSSYNNVVFQVRAAGAPAAPTGLTAELNHLLSDREVSLSWTASSGAEGYYLKRSTTNGSGHSTIATRSSSQTSHTDTTVKEGTTYYYVVSAFNGGGESPNSNQVSVFVPSFCGDEAMPAPTPTSIHSASGWDLTAEVSANDGVVVRDVSLNGRYMARSISVPYFTIATSTTSGVVRGELKSNGTGPGLRTRLVEYNPVDTGFGIVIFAHYIIDRISPTSNSCLHVWQTYFFNGKLVTGFFQGGKPCEPSGTVPCQTFFPQVAYKFESKNNEVLFSFNAIQRNEFRANGLPFQSIGIFRDCDSLPPFNCGLVEVDIDEGRISAFKNKLNPLTTELKARVIERGEDTGHWDNIHETYNSRIFKEPGVAPFEPNARYFALAGGCPECVHMHWRWGKVLDRPQDYGNGSVGLFYPNTDQNMEIAIVKHKAFEQENAEPLDYATLANNESIRLGADIGDQVLVYYSSTGHKDEDTFFKHLYFFNPDFGSSVRPVQRNQPASTENSTTTTEDGPISVTFPHVYRDGTVSFTEIDPNLVGQLPQGYVAYNSVAYNITTDAEVSGPYVVSFGVPSATDQTVFNTLRILHAEPDPLDPDSGIWVDRTILAPDAQGPDFTGKVINARVDNLASFVIARLIQPQPPNTGTADLSLSTSSAPDPVIAPNNLTYTITINNSGPDIATGVGLVDTLAPEVKFFSASPSQGSCKLSDGIVYCKLGSLNNSASALITIVVTLNEGETRFPAEGQEVVNTAFVSANENDPNKGNNTSIKSNNALREGNAPPTVSITSPTSGARYVGPANITITASASDSDGTIAQVDFYDMQTLIGIGTPSGPNQFSLVWNNVSFGDHLLIAQTTDNGGRKKTSDAVKILVNGTATVSITNPATDSVIAPHTNVTISANVSHPSGVINKVEFFASSVLLGTVAGAGASQYSIPWNDVPNGKYSLTAVVTDGAGITTTSTAVNVVVSNAPTISISGPQDGTIFPSSAVIAITASVQDEDSIIDKVNFYANGTLLGTGLRSGLDKFTFTWRGAVDGIYLLTATTADQYGLTTTSAGVTIGVNTPSARPGELGWFDDALPPGATPHGDGEGWYWVDANPGALSGTKAHQSRNFAQLDLPNNSFHQHYFDGATMTLPVNAGDKLFTYVFLDINNMPREIMLQWKDGNGWEHRAYWGANRINFGTDGSNSRRYMGPLPKAGQWVRLEVPASAVGLEGATLSGMAFALDAGRATFDLAGKTTQNALPLPTTPDEFVWFEDAAPAGSILEAIDDQWSWEPPAYSGQYSHRSYFTSNQGNGQFRSHSFRGAQAPMTIEPGAVLFTYVYVDPNHKPDELVLQWHDGSSWEHRAYWGQNFFPGGTTGTESRRFMGGLPTAGQWVRLEVPASYVGLEGKTVSGMAFGFYSSKDRAGINWDRAGKSSQAAKAPLPLSALTPVYRFFNSNYGWSYSTNDIGLGNRITEGLKFYVHPNQAAGTVPFYRFRNSNSGESTTGYFYSQNSPNPNIWALDGIAFYVYPDGTTPGTVPLHLFHDIHFRYFLTTDYNEGVSKGLSYDAVWAYVLATNPLVPAAPSNLIVTDGGYNIRWRDNSATETGFKILRADPAGGVFSQIATGAANATEYKTANRVDQGAPDYRYIVRAFNSFGDSASSNEACYFCLYPDEASNTPPEVYISSPANGDVVPTDFAITANAFDIDGNGTIAKVEFFQGNSKLGESNEAPYLFVWNSVPPGTYVLTAKATDTAGAITTSSGVTVTVSAPTPTPTPTPLPSASPTPTPIPTRENVALASNGGIASASSQESPYTTNHTNDGERLGYTSGQYSFWRDNTNNTWPDWLQIDFNGSKTIDEIDVFTVQNNAETPATPTEAMTFSLHGVTAFDVQYWNGSSWLTITGGSVTGNNKVWRKFTFAAITTSKIRVTVNAALNSRSRIVELEAYGTAAGPVRDNVAHVANGGAVTASSAEASFPASYSNDGERLGYTSGHYSFWRDATAGVWPDWVQIDFNGSKTIDEIDVFTVQDNAETPTEPTESLTFSLHGITAFDVQYWDGGAWVTVPNGSVTGNNKVWRKFTFAAITTSKIRVTVNGALNTRSRIVEVEAYGVPAAPARTNVGLAANGGVVSASSQESPYTTNYTNDGERLGYISGHYSFWRDNTNNAWPDWLQIDFAGSKTIDEIDVFTVQDNAETPSEPTEALTFSLYGITAFDVQYWDGSAWVTVSGGSVTGNNKVWRKFTFSAITTSKIRVTINAALNSRSRVVELEAYGPLP